MASCFGSSGHDIVLIIPSTHALEHLIEATLGSFVTTTTDLNDRKGWEWQEWQWQKPKTRKQWGKRNHLHFIANVHFDNA